LCDKVGLAAINVRSTQRQSLEVRQRARFVRGFLPASGIKKTLFTGHVFRVTGAGVDERNSAMTLAKSGFLPPQKGIKET
jgi:hypothetical protein